MNMKSIDRLPTLAALVFAVLGVAACSVRLREDEGQINTPESTGVTSDPLARKLGECRSVTYEQKDALSECRKVWAEKRRQFLGQKAPAASDTGAGQAGSTLFVAPKDESRLPPDDPPIQQIRKE
jgi:conjugative transfer region protein TrbK